MNDRRHGPTHESKFIGFLRPRITVSGFLMGFSGVFWTIPGLAIFIDEVRPKVFNLSVGFAASFSAATFLAGLFYSFQCRAAERHEEENERIRAEQARTAEALADLNDVTNGAVHALTQRIDRVATQTMQEKFNALGDAYIDLQGGPAVVEREVTKPLPDAKIYRIPQHLVRNNERPAPHDNRRSSTPGRP